MNRSLAAIAQVTVAAGMLGMAGCGESASPAAAPSSKPNAADPAEPVASKPVRDTWDVYTLHGKRIGYGHTTIRHEVEAGQAVVATQRRDHLSLKRDGQATELDMNTSSVETEPGRLIRFDTEMRLGPNPRRTVGQVRGDRLVIETTSVGVKPTRESIAWSPNTGGPFGVEQSLVRKPMQPGERRTLKELMVEFNQVADVELIAKRFEPTPMLHGAYDLLRIDVIWRLPDGQKIEGAIWTDRTGETLKGSSPAMGMDTYRVSKAEALDKVDAAELDLLTSTIIKLPQPLPHAHQTKQVRYRVHLDGGDPAGVFTTGPNQTVKSIDAHTAEVTVFAIRPGVNGGNADAKADPPTDADRKPNSYLQSDDPTIAADARKAAGDERDPWRTAVALERYVHRAVKKKDYSQAFTTAAEVAKSLEGDCTEHAVFLAALARARGIPARVAIGLVYMEGRQAFGYHMWTEVYVDGRWIPIDGTLAQGGIGAAHLTIAQTNLDGTSVYGTFLPVVQILGRLGIEVIDAK